MDVPDVIRHRLKELGLEQKDLAAAARVTESYVSQLLARKKDPPAPDRTGIYDRIGLFLRLPAGELSRLAELQRQEESRKRTREAPNPLFQECRKLIVRKCDPERQAEICRIFNKEPFGELERLVTQKILDAAKRVASDGLESDEWMQSMRQLSGQTSDDARKGVLEFLNTDVFSIALERCVPFLGQLIESWDIDLGTFSIEITLDRRWTNDYVVRFEFVERESNPGWYVEPGLEEFLKDASLSGSATEEEIRFLRRLTFTQRRPTAVYYYRELQNLRDPLHFRPLPVFKETR